MKVKDIPVISMEKTVNRNYVDEQISDEFFMSIQGKVPGSAFNYPFRLDGLIMIICRRGSCELVIDLIRHSVKPNDFFFILPGSIIQLGDKSEDLLLYVMGASTDFLSDKSMKTNIQLFLHVKDNPKINLDEEESEMLFSFIEFIRSKLIRTDHIYRREIVQS